MPGLFPGPRGALSPGDSLSMASPWCGHLMPETLSDTNDTEGRGLRDDLRAEGRAERRELR